MTTSIFPSTVSPFRAPAAIGIAFLRAAEVWRISEKEFFVREETQLDNAEKTFGLARVDGFLNGTRGASDMRLKCS